MKQPSKKRKPKQQPEKNSIVGIDYCNECAFLKFNGKTAICNASDVVLDYDDMEQIKVPTWCGNKRHDEKRV